LACPPIPARTVEAILRRHGLPFLSQGIAVEAWNGAAGCVYPLGTGIVLKVAHANPDAIACLRTEAVAAPAAHAAGVRTPALLIFDDTRELLSAPYAVFERVPGVPLGSLALPPEMAANAWHALGQELAKVHAIESATGPLAGLRSFRQSPEVDPRPWVIEFVESGRCATDAADWLIECLDRIAPAALAPLPLCLCHGDINADNVLVDPASLEFLALIDWAGAGWLDPAWDFAGVPLRAVPFMLAGHRAVSPLVDDATAEARILWCHTQFALSIVRGTAAPTPGAPDPALTKLLADVREFAQRFDLV
jgi:hygromycin-B 7''-O-kinase